MKPLTKREFVTALKKGQGRAFIHVKESGLTKYKDDVLKACLENQSYDPQIDFSRAFWLHGMFIDTPYYDEFKTAIIQQLQESTDWEDRMQLFEIIGEMAKAEDQNARKILKEHVFQAAKHSEEDEGFGIESWIELQTVDEFLSLARIYGDRLIANPEEYIGINLLPVGREQEFLLTVEKQAEKDVSQKKYFDHLTKEIIPIKKFNKTKRRQEFRQEHTLEIILHDARQKKGKFPYRYSTFGRYATKRELQIIFEETLQEKDPLTVLRLLWVFRRTPMPEVNEYVIHLAKGNNKQVRSAAIAALAQLKDERIHNLAQELIIARLIECEYHEVLDLFIHNFTSSDPSLILSALQTKRLSVDDIHSLGYSLLDISERQNSPSLTELLLWVYEKTPCMQCRFRSLEELNKYDGIPKEIWAEIEYDANESIRNLWKTRQSLAP